MNSEQLNELLEPMVLEVVAGTLLKNIKRRLESFTTNEELVNKLLRIIEIRSQELGA